jgi:tetratricopeptide (TPR) repeat protein
VQRGGNRMRVNVQLIDAQSGAHVWAERFYKQVTDLFDLQDEVVARIANALNAQLVAAEARRAEQSPHPDAMDLYFQGRAWFHKAPNPENQAQARRFFEHALELDPNHIDALGWIAAVDILSGHTARSPADRAARFATAEAAAAKALSLAPDHAPAHLCMGMSQIYTNRAAQGIAECERALALDRNLAPAHAHIGFAKIALGRSEETEAHIHEALRLSPRDPFAYLWAMFAGIAKFYLGRDEEAVAWLQRSIEINRNYFAAHFLLAAALAQCGKLDEARATAMAALAINPNFTIRHARANSSSDPVNRVGRERAIEGMRKAGVPEG